MTDNTKTPEMKVKDTKGEVKVVEVEVEEETRVKYKILPLDAWYMRPRSELVEFIRTCTEIFVTRALRSTSTS